MASIDNKLYAPESYWTASPEVRNQVINGCGTAGWKGWIVPDTIYFLNIVEACKIHDWMYTCGQTLADKQEADRVFLNNMLRIIEAKTRIKTLKKLRAIRAREYYEAVEHFGGPAFWAGKNPPQSMAA